MVLQWLLPLLCGLWPVLLQETASWSGFLWRVSSLVNMPTLFSWLYLCWGPGWLCFLTGDDWQGLSRQGCDWKEDKCRLSLVINSLPASKSFPMSQLFVWGGQSTGVSALASFLPKKSQGWSPSQWTGWISLQSKGLSRVFSNTTVQKHQSFGTQPSSQSNSHIHTWPQEKP